MSAGKITELFDEVIIVLQRVVYVIVLFNPPVEDIEHIEQICSRGWPIVLVDNSPNARNVLDDALKYPNATYIHNANEGGLARALNRGVRYAVDELSAEWVCCLDQDSRLPSRFSDEMEKVIEKVDGNVAMIAPNFVDRNSNTYSTFIDLTRWTWRKVTVRQGPYGEDSQCTPVAFAITSGSLLNAGWFVKAGNFREDFFIDHIDSEYCVRLIKLGAKILVNGQCVMSHAVGNRQVKRIGWLTLKPNNHSKVRRYYIARNGVLVCRLHGRRYPSLVSLNFARLVHEVLCIALFEAQKPAKLAAICKGLLDGFRHSLRTVADQK